MFDKNTLLDFAKLATLAYEDQATMDKLYQKCKECPDDNPVSVLKYCMECPKLFESKENDCEVYITKYNNTAGLDCLAVAFRGTSEVRDALSDLNAIRCRMSLPYQDESPMVHWGFYNQFQEIKKDLDYQIDQYYVNSICQPSVDNNHIVFCGHSLGGGLATLASVYYGAKYPALNIHCVTIGSPRVGGTKFHKLFDEIVENSYRIVNKNDIVTMIPSRFRFSHVKGLMWLKDNTVKKTMTNRFFSSCTNTFINWFGFGGSSSLDDHGCDQYLETMNKNL